MARKKKTTKKITTEEVKVSAPQKDTLTYQGKITVKILHGERVISTKNYTNSGLPNLFKFICHALAGSYYKNLQPCKIKLFNFLDAEKNKISPTNFVWPSAQDDTHEIKEALKSASPFVLYDSTPVVDYNENTKEYATTFRFKIPFYWITQPQFNVIGLYASDEVSIEEASAYYLLTEKDTNNVLQWKAEELGTEIGNFSIVIDWTMTVSNK